MVENSTRRVIIVGLPGVGKTTLISKAVELLKKRDCESTVVIFGSLMLEESRELHLTNRDQMRRLSVDEQRRLQQRAAGRIAAMKEDLIIIDTHLLISTEEGYYPGLPLDLLDTIKPTNIIMISADPADILERRTQDKSRDRDIRQEMDIRDELEISKTMIACCSLVSGCSFISIMNNNNEIDKAAASLASCLLGNSGKI
ncbi:adenylate kinase [Nitrososphaera sp. AFS]|uniref:adenylate kinase n=1 Tax=Nitrososphaera sp. AFS TaxID=2301191 RepID=UPI001392406A|nr:adenylate kinase [Nitrososphaera sp. AFS]NAL76666.1 adenylate kinase [Nitrososphaera sp. AFS]